jgi:hypothetical protein
MTMLGVANVARAEKVETRYFPVRSYARHPLIYLVHNTRHDIRRRWFGSGPFTKRNKITGEEWLKARDRATGADNIELETLDTIFPLRSTDFVSENFFIPPVGY